MWVQAHVCMCLCSSQRTNRKLNQGRKSKSLSRGHQRCTFPTGRSKLLQDTQAGDQERLRHRLPVSPSHVPPGQQLHFEAVAFLHFWHPGNAQSSHFWCFPAVFRELTSLFSSFQLLKYFLLLIWQITCLGRSHQRRHKQEGFHQAFRLSEHSSSAGTSCHSSTGTGGVCEGIFLGTVCWAPLGAPLEGPGTARGPAAASLGDQKRCTSRIPALYVRKERAW